ILRLYGNGGGGYPEVAVVTLPPGQTAGSPAGRLALRRAFGAVAREPGLRVADYASTGDRGFLSSDGRTTYGLVFTPFAGELSPPSLGPQITAAMTPALPGGSQVRVTGMNELTSGGQTKEGLGVLAETLLAGAAALAVLAFAIRSTPGRGGRGGRCRVRVRLSPGPGAAAHGRRGHPWLLPGDLRPDRDHHRQRD